MERTANAKEWLTTRDIAAELGVPLSTVYKWTRRGQPEFPRASRLPNGELRVRRADFDRWMKDRVV